MWVPSRRGTTLWTQRTVETPAWASWTRLLSTPNLHRWGTMSIKDNSDKPDQKCIYLVGLTVCVCQQESKWSLFKRKLKPSTTFENPSYSEVSSDTIRCYEGGITAVVSLSETSCRLTDEGWKARSEQRGPPGPRALPLRPSRQTSPQGTSERLLADRGQLQRHGQPGEGGQRRITPSLSHRQPWGEEREKRNTLCTEFIFLCSLCTKLKLF